MIIQQQIEDIATPKGIMRTRIFRPMNKGRFPAIIFYSEIFQITSPITRSAQMMAAHGFVVLVPEIFHELNPMGTVLAYDDIGKNKGNADKFSKALEDHDSDTQAMLDFVTEQNYCNGQVGSMGVCIGGHLAFRAALNHGVKAAFCLYPTDIHSNTLPCQTENDSLNRCGDIQGEVVMVFGKQDPHVSAEGRALIHQTMQHQALNFSWHEVNAQHAFMRDEGERYDGALAMQCYVMAVALFQRNLYQIV
jgi:carboxymethylenebutenolidase